MGKENKEAQKGSKLKPESSEGSASGSKRKRGSKQELAANSPDKSEVKKGKASSSKGSPTKPFSGLRENNGPPFSPLLSPTPDFSIHAGSLNTPGSSVKSLHVDTQHRIRILQKVSAVTTPKEGPKIAFGAEFEATGRGVMLELLGLWTELKWMEPGTLVNVVGVPLECSTFTVNNHQGYVIVEPDKLISATTIVSHLFCERKTALGFRFYMGGADNVNTFRGVLAHELICQAMEYKHVSREELMKCSQRICQEREMLDRAYGNQLTDATLYWMQYEVVTWVAKFMTNRFLTSGKQQDPKQSFRFVNLIGVEDNIWNPTYGLKGKIDATVQIQYGSNEKIIVPLEFKTGTTKPYSEKRNIVKVDHIGQVSLYTLMMTMRFGAIQEALLYYISDDCMSVHQKRELELQHLMMHRNNIVRETRLNVGILQNLPSAKDVDFEFKCKNWCIETSCMNTEVWSRRQ